MRVNDVVNEIGGSRSTLWRQLTAALGVTHSST